ncbi:MAG: hypothetical protein CL850_01850 [Crocinitomicaceae bacterium]|nr:hypothetical protein [Crocinitomicaceae bacterium]
MKRSHLVLLILVALLVGLLVFTYSSSNQSVTFTQAAEKSGVEVTITGTLYKEEPVIYNPKENASLTKFHMEDSKGQIMEVHLQMAKPQGLLQSESIVIDGSYSNGIFYATDMLLKCPSKYNSENHLITES